MATEMTKQCKKSNFDSVDIKYENALTGSFMLLKKASSYSFKNGADMLIVG